MSGKSIKSPSKRVDYERAIAALLNLHRELRRASTNIQASGITGKQLAILRFLNEPGEKTVGHVAAYVYVNESTASEVIAKMEERGLVNRLRSKKDNRVVVVEPTEQGSHLVGTTALEGIPLLRDRLKELTDERLTVLAENLELLHSLLDHSNKQHPQQQNSNKEDERKNFVPTLP